MAPLPTGTVTFLFTDIEGSTTRWEQQREAMQAALARHDAIMRDAIEAHGGHVFKTVGDAFYAVFTSSPDALKAALAAQHALQAEAWGEAASPLRVRVALHTGTVQQRDGDYFGPPLNRVARLLSAGHGGQVLLSAAMQELVRDQLLPSTELRSLGEHRLKDLIRPEHIFQVVAPGLSADFPPLKTLDNRPNNLPLQPTPFIGRERELEAVRRRLHDPEVRLLTLTGPGGTGKTRLALQAAADLLDAFPDGVWFVNLAPITDPALVASTIATTLGVADVAGRPLLDGLKHFLRDRHLLLVVDNFEQVMPAAPLLAELVGAAPELKVLVTSRMLLRLYGEHDVAVPPLALPDLKHLPPLERLSQYEAVRLFIERAQAVKPDFTITNENAPAVAELCTRLDGLPLAIELAAARVRFLPPHALLERLGSRLKLLTGGPRDLPARHQTLRNTIDWSYSLLEPGEQTLFARLAVFVGGSTLDAAEAVCNANGDLSIDPFEGVALLVDKHLLQQVEGPTREPRFGMLETIREYAVERLEASGAGEALRRQHAAYFLALAETAEPAFAGPEQVAWLEQLEVEHTNLRTALAWALGAADSQGTDVALGMQLAGRLGQFWERRGHLREGRQWLERAVEQGGADSAIPATVRGRARYSLAWMIGGPRDQRAVRTHYEASLALFREAGDKQGMAQALYAVGEITWFGDGDPVAGRAHMDESLALFREVGDKAGLADVLVNLGAQAFSRDDYTTGHTYVDESLRLARELGDKRGIASAFHVLGIAASGRGDYPTARRHCEASLALLRELGDTWRVSILLNNLGRLQVAQGDGVAAERLLEESLGLLRDTGDTGPIPFFQHGLALAVLLQGDAQRAAALLTEGLAQLGEMETKGGVFLFLEGLAVVAAAEQQPGRAGRLWGAAAALRKAFDAPLHPGDAAIYERWLAPARAHVGGASWQAAVAEGRAMSLEQAVAYALETGDPAS